MLQTYKLIDTSYFSIIYVWICSLSIKISEHWDDTHTVELICHCQKRENKLFGHKHETQMSKSLFNYYSTLKVTYRWSYIKGSHKSHGDLSFQYYTINNLDVLDEQNNICWKHSGSLSK